MASVSRKPQRSRARVAPAEPAPLLLPRAERLAAGKALRDSVPRASHAEWKPSAKHRDPIDILEASNKDRVPELVPIRYGRMLASPFTFLRGSAGLMASDLAATPNTGIRVQACGDCHLLNFGMFATPERNLVFDLNDFDETLPAPWEWDLKRLAVSFAVAARDNKLSDADARDAAETCGRAYREALRGYSRMSPLEVWYARLDVETLIATAPDEQARKIRRDLATKARQRVIENLFPRIVGEVAGKRRLVDQPPVLFHVSDPEAEELMREGVAAYRESLPDERRVLFDRYRLEDSAAKVVGIGSVGTRCLVALFFDKENHPLILQIKEAVPSVLAPYAGKSRYDNQGQRVVVGQRLMQSSSDIFLGWARGRHGRDFFVRQLRDMKFSPPVEGFKAVHLKRYAVICGGILARAHAKSGDASSISGYLGKSDRFDQALGAFALAYADQNEQDHAALVQAVNAGRVEALIEEA
ncbi:MAG: hypothetical protein FD187_1826 [bacterium]|nr:MAG: hypothetical protein FD142_1151 [bacterium]KAF0148637.1 MAG: hypothetical protein FD187_1826 [bacterium]KAF0167941.1 MAG: hypothetical protein FD158_1836 [bacterium]TXT18153.1 MAG: hypothetical protein FD132_2151 [bacterium]